MSRIAAERTSPLEQMFSQIFRGGEVTRRELRLTPQEAEHLRAFAHLRPLSEGGGEKRWYEVQLKGVLPHE